LISISIQLSATTLTGALPLEGIFRAGIMTVSIVIIILVVISNTAAAHASQNLVGVIRTCINTVRGVVAVPVGILLVTATHTRLGLITVGAGIDAVGDTIRIDVKIHVTTATSTRILLKWVTITLFLTIGPLVTVGVSVGDIAATNTSTSGRIFVGIIDARIGAVGLTITISISIRSVATTLAGVLLVRVSVTDFEAILEVVTIGIIFRNSTRTVVVRSSEAGLGSIIVTGINAVSFTITIRIDIGHTTTANARVSLLRRVLGTGINTVGSTIRVEVIVSNVTTANARVELAYGRVGALVDTVTGINAAITVQVSGGVDLTTATDAGSKLVSIIGTLIITVGSGVRVIVGIGFTAATQT
jgi:hypothetical protein